MDAPAFQTILYFHAIVSGDRFPGQVTVNSPDEETHETRLSELFSTLAAKKDEHGNDLFVTFEPREVSGSSARASSAARTAAPAAPAGIPPCPIHNVPLKAKTNRRDNSTFYSCGEKTGPGPRDYCNWKPPA